ncbi:hypothetical protein AVEN_174300-1 [Araneus ventricosus]|uniref:RNase H type-1 domain-containing protein n=1 Tax=Araneus ventricosus TaxID=182803 RepID=A0A4Y2KF54_ARAVE|nr:hypothetical protein AVEN_252657-1 [Araneus ventricosus]GBN01354.1 hypothetical protein AVEN_78915-1 [Araneus ventricosus]GBN01386.1 hypothetical protein AVEN_173700-1 [Araneus ventricosus]GBN01391.1 hypothetical protein AVEN_174300-1 [Araneus ventricosus]
MDTDGLSSISAINSSNTRSEFVNKVKSDIFKAKNMVGLSWVKAHVGIPGNELADQQAKLAITSGEKLFIPAPYSHLKRLLKNYIVNKWNEYWNSYDSTSGIRVRGYINQFARDFLLDISSQDWFSFRTFHSSAFCPPDFPPVESFF